MKMNEKMAEAIRNNGKPLRLIESDEDRREAAMQDAQEMGTRGNEKKSVDHMWVDRMQQDLYGKHGVRPYVGKRNARRKGTIRNHTERVTINRISRKG
jgi:hypothetical protein